MGEYVGDVAVLAPGGSKGADHADLAVLDLERCTREDKRLEAFKLPKFGGSDEIDRVDDRGAEVASDLM